MYYAILIYGVEGIFDRLPEAQKQTFMKKHGDLQADLSAGKELGPVVRLTGTSGALTIRKQGDSVVVTDGPFAEMKEALLGLYVVEAETIGEAIGHAKRLPIEIGSVEVRPVGCTGGATVAMSDG